MYAYIYAHMCVLHEANHCIIQIEHCMRTQLEFKLDKSLRQKQS